MQVLLWGSAALSLLHALLPNHWLPFVLLAQTEGWTVQQTIRNTLIAVIAHLLSTTSIGITIGWTSLQLRPYFLHWLHFIGAMLFGFLGIYFLFRSPQRHHHRKKRDRQTRSILVTLVIAMFFSPCLELTAYYIPAAAYGWNAIIGISLVYIFTTSVAVLTLVLLGYYGLAHFLQHHPEQVHRMVHRLTGVIFVIFGILLMVSE